MTATGGYKMPKVSKSGPAGLAKVQVGAKTGKVKATVTYKDANKQEVVEEIIVDRENCPKWIKSGVFRVKFSGDKKKMFGAVPANEQVVCQFKEFKHEEGQKPAPEEVTGGMYGPYMQMVMILEVVEGHFKGLEIPVFMRYNFVKLEDGDKVVAALPNYKTAKHLRMLEDTLYSLGILDYGALPWKDNLLPLIQTRARRSVEEKGTKIIANIGPDGYVASIGPVVTDLDEEEDDGFGDLEGDDEGEGAGDHDTRNTPTQAKNAPVSEPDPDDDEDYDAGSKDGESTDDDDIDWGDEEV